MDPSAFVWRGLSFLCLHIDRHVRDAEHIKGIIPTAFWSERLLLRNPLIILWRTLVHDESHHRHLFPQSLTLSSTLHLQTKSSSFAYIPPPTSPWMSPPLYPHCREFGSSTLVRVTMCFLPRFSKYAFALLWYILHISQIWWLRASYEHEVHLFKVVCWFLIAFSQVWTPGRYT